MLKTVIVLPDGTELSSGPGETNAIQSTSIIECVNSGTELTIGSVCSNSIEVKVIAPDGKLHIAEGTVATAYREDEHGNRTKVGRFTLQAPTRLTANTSKILGYDFVSNLDKDLTAWLSGLDGWPYTLDDFADMVCDKCGLRYAPSDVPNANYEIHQFSRSTVTGRQIMRWLGEICCSFCRADADGNIEFAWYTPADAKITPTGDSYYFQNGLSYEDYAVAPVEAVQIRLADSENGALWPKAAEGANSYVITGNPILSRSLDQTVLQPVLGNIRARLAEVTYTPCKVDLPATVNIHAGNTVQITDKNGVTFTAYVMTKTQTGQKDRLESTGSPRRDSSSAMNNKTQTEIAEEVVRSQTGDDIFNKLTKNGTVQGIYQQDGKWYINAELVQVFNLVANSIISGQLKSKDGKIYFDLDLAELVCTGDDGGVSVKNGQFTYSAPEGKGSISFGALVGDKGGPCMFFKDSAGNDIFSIIVFNNEARITSKHINSGEKTNQKIGLKTISFLNASGNAQTEDFYVSYE